MNNNKVSLGHLLDVRRTNEEQPAAPESYPDEQQQSLIGCVIPDTVVTVVVCVPFGSIEYYESSRSSSEVNLIGHVLLHSYES